MSENCFRREGEAPAEPIRDAMAQRVPAIGGFSLDSNFDLSIRGEFLSFRLVTRDDVVND